MRSSVPSAYAAWLLVVISSLVIPALIIPSLAAATDLTLSLEGFSEYDNNVFRDSTDEEDDVLFRIRPTFKIHEDRGQDARYSLQYGIPFEFAVENGSELDDIDHHATGNITYHVNDRIEMFATGGLHYLRSGLRQTDVEGPSEANDTPFINSERERVFRNDASAGMSYNFSPRLSGTTTLSWDFFDPEREDRARNYLLSGNASLSYVAAPKHSIGGAVVISHQDFDDRLNIEGSETQSYGVRGQWIYRFDETTTFSANLGPSVIRTQQDDAPALETGVQLVPFVDVAGQVSGKLNEAGLPFNGGGSGTVGAGSILVGNFLDCAEISPGQFVAQGGSCPLDIVLDVAAVPTLIDDIRNSTASLVNTNPDGEDDTSINVFGEITLRKDWAPNLHSALRYEREQGGGSGLGGAVIRDAVSFSNTWEASERWQFTARADWSLRETVTELTQVVVGAENVDTTTLPTPFVTGANIAGIATSPDTAPGGNVGSNITLQSGDSEISTMRWGISGRTTYRFSRNTSGNIQLTYNQQESENGTLGNASDFENFLAAVSVRYVFNPIKLW